VLTGTNPDTSSAANAIESFILRPPIQTPHASQGAEYRALTQIKSVFDLSRFAWQQIARRPPREKLKGVQFYSAALIGVAAQRRTT
jgi:hypothetical protein